MIPSLALTMGDPAGIGAEIMLKALTNDSSNKRSHIIIVGNRQLLQQTYNHLLQQTALTPADLANPESLSILDVPFEGTLTWGQGNALTGGFSFACLEKAI
ncbi:MAG: 4-hydroxythreonine-4-phosphate dehydrogenase, partial [Cyanobacteria bacterium P01_A01_bin.40]